MSRPYNRHPLGAGLIAGLAVLLALLLAMFVIDALAYAYHRIGIGEGALFGLVLASLLGGTVNIPIARLRGRPSGVEEVVVFGIRYRLPVVRRPQESILAVNLGGALIPLGVSVLLLVRDGIWWQAGVGILIVTVVVHRIARPVAGLGVVVPGLLPPLLAAATALVVAPHAAAAAAYVAGSLGTLIGADLLNLPALGDLGPGVASIGGAGTFDGIFLSGVIAVLLVGLT